MDQKNCSPLSSQGHSVLTAAVFNFRLWLVVSLLFTLFSCSLFDKDNTPEPAPLVPYKPELTPRLLWSAKTGSGVGKEYLKASPTLTPTSVLVTSIDGTVTSVSKKDGHINWQVNAQIPISTGAGYAEGIIVVGSNKGDVVALQETNGQTLWQIKIDGELIAKPAAGYGVAIIKTTDGLISALALNNGEERWSYQQMEPNLVLRATSSPLITDHHVVLGFANGNLVKLGLGNGQLIWQQAIAFSEGAFPIQRMIDIDANPILFNHHLYAATYQGKIAALDLSTGKIRWSNDISSYTGMVADETTVFISDAQSHLWAFGAENGFVTWRQNQLDARRITGPALMADYLVVGDIEGYLHWISKCDGHVLAREPISGSIFAAPVAENGVVYAVNNYGYLVAYTVS